MLNFTNNDRQIIIDSYKKILWNLKVYLQKYKVISETEYSKIIFYMLHSGYFSIDKKIRFDNNYDYLGLPLTISQGVQVMYGICCCRHATEFLYDILKLLNFNPSLLYLLIDNSNGVWRTVDPAIEKANHQAILLPKENKYILDPANGFILQVLNGGEIKSLDTSFNGSFWSYSDENIDVVGKVLKKYYMYKELGIERVYD